ncbi:EAL domain-containing protein [Erythrobacter sp. A6_0]|uniref:putative bifunctional diguanylate cyclase/phosphodiesterase n=1 Tax=Erythrobacter sp. A6_0 TaxID=2821089 RepID=UPI001FD7BB42|nr:EAL domain-containing protein [Erythrobacter sp. A6_0]
MKAVDDVLIVAVTDRAGRILYANQRFCQISGYSHDELVGANHRILNSGHHDRGFFKEMFRTICDGQTWRGEICNRAKDGSLYWVSTTIIPELDENGAVCRFVSCRFDITEQKHAEQQMREMAVTDALTGLQNRHGFRLRFDHMLHQARTLGENLALLMLDMDNFKDINDVNGHESGDLFLKIVTNRLSQILECDDLIARLGGDEIAIVVPRANLEAVEQLIARLQHALSNTIDIHQTSLLATASIGLALYPADGCTAAELINSADIALYAAKHSGKNRCVRFNPEMLKRTRNRVLRQEQAFAGLERGEFELYYQPIVSLGSDEAASCEALLRWHHPIHGLIAPGQFLDVFESHRLSVTIGQFVQHAAIRQARSWIEAAVPFEKIKLNTTASDFEAPGFADRLLKMLDEYGIGVERIGVEVTEGMFLGHKSDNIRRELRALNDTGVEIAFDDFGTGFASLTHLKELPINRIKIDQSFITNLTSDTRDQNIVHSLITLAHKLGKSVTAEGVETDEQIALLEAMGCDRLQGYYFSKPICAESAADMLWQLSAQSKSTVAAAR